MAENSKIEWCDHTFNPWIGCTKVGPGCDNCYAETQDNHRKWTPEGWGAGKPRKRTSIGNWNKPLQWNAKAGANKTRYRVFCASLADVFDNEVPQEWREDLFELIECTPHLDWLLLTKRVGNVEKMIPSSWASQFPGNVWMGITVVNQEEADRDIPKLLRIPARIRWLSMEPLLGPVSIHKYLYGGHQCAVSGFPADHPHACGDCDPCINTAGFNSPRGLDWVVVGGESGSSARPMNPSWVISLRDQCIEACEAFLFKQWGEWAPESAIQDDVLLDISGPPSLLDKEVYTGFQEHVYRVGKKKAGRMLDGRTWDEYPC